MPEAFYRTLQAPATGEDSSMNLGDWLAHLHDLTNGIWSGGLIGVVVIILCASYLIGAGIEFCMPHKRAERRERRRIRRVQAEVDAALARIQRELELQAAAGFSQPPRGCGPTTSNKRVG